MSWPVRSFCWPELASEKLLEWLIDWLLEAHMRGCGLMQAVQQKYALAAPRADAWTVVVCDCKALRI
eukprot:366091-Chlamydomonas_euryale.AAC.1